MQANSHKKYMVLSLLIALALLVRLFPIDTSYFFWDESVYLLHAKAFAGYGVGYTEHEFRPPLLPYLLSFAVRYGLDLEIFSRVLMALLNSAAVIVAFYCGRLLDEKTAWIASVFAAFMPYHILASRWVMTDVLASILLSACAVLFYYGLSLKPSGPSKACMAFSGALFSLSILAKFTSMLMVLPLSLFYIVRLKASDAKLQDQLAKIAWFIVPAIVILIPYMVFAWSLFENPVQPFLAAMHVVSNEEPVDFLIVLFSLFDFFGLLLLVLFGVMFFVASEFVQQTQRGTGRMQSVFLSSPKNFIFLWAGIMLAYYLFIIQQGVSKPPTMEWEMERFLFPAFIPVVVLCSYFLSRLSLKPLIASIAIILLLQSNVYARIYLSSIDYEEGLRHVAKNAATFAKANLENNSVIVCSLNCPVLAYYSNRQTYYLKSGQPYDGESDNLYYIRFDKTSLQESNALRFPLMYTEEKGLWSVRIYKISARYLQDLR